MVLINVKKPFRYAIGGMHVVEFCVGVHEVAKEIAKTAIDELKVATESKDKKDVLPALTHDINGSPLPVVDAA